MRLAAVPRRDRQPRGRADRGQRLAAKAERADREQILVVELRGGVALDRSARSARVMPPPSSVTRISRRPPPSVSTSILRAPASSAFSTSSLTTLAGRSITSPAAMRLIGGFGKLADGHRDVIRVNGDDSRENRGETAVRARGFAPAIPSRSRAAAGAALDLGAVFLAFEPLLLLGPSGPWWRAAAPARTAASRISSNSRSRASARLRSCWRCSCASDDDHAVLGQPLAGQLHQPDRDVVRQRRRTPHVEAQLHRRRDLVDVLPAGAGRADEGLDSSYSSMAMSGVTWIMAAR